MSDSDLSDAFDIQNEGSIVSASGPNINISNLKGLGFRNNDLTTTMNKPSMSRNFEWPRRPESNYNQKTKWSRRETSPMSTASACDVRQRNYDNSSYSRALCSQRSNSRRARSPTMSVRSIDSNASAVDIITAIKHFNGSEYDLKMIQKACLLKRHMKHRTMRGIEKRRNRRVFLKGCRRESRESGELGSNSSSSDDDRSTRTFKNKNMTSCRSTNMDIADIRRNIRDTNMVKDCTNNFRQNMLSMANGSTGLNSIRSSVSLSKSMIDKPTIPKSFLPPITNINITHNQSSMNHSKFYRDRIENRNILPYQRFNQSIAATSIPEISSRQPVPQEQISDDDEIFSKPTPREKPTSSLGKRGYDREDDILCLPNNKKLKINIVHKDFEFVKPACPVPKQAHVKAKETIISTSTNMNPTDKLIAKSASLPPIQNNFESEYENDNNELQTTSQSNTDVSTRPSFMKRKLFSQKMDVTEKTNDIANSPQNSVYGKIQKEKNKARKLVTSQYCLSRDIHSDENNILDLIYKIVPAECMTATAQSNKTVTQNKSEDKVIGDVTSIFSPKNTNEDDLSDTFTDEDALIITCNGELPSPKAKKVCKSPLKKVQKSPQKSLLEKSPVKKFQKSPQKSLLEKSPVKKLQKSPQKSLLENSPVKKLQKSPQKSLLKSPVKKLQKSPNKVYKLTENILAEKNGTPTKVVKKMEKYIKSFWDTDFESDVEFTPVSRKEKKPSKENKNTDAAPYVAYKPAFQGSMNPVNNTTVINTTVDNTKKFNNTSSVFKLCSHRISKPKKIACVKVNESTTQLIPVSSQEKNTISNTSLEVKELVNYTQPVNKKTVNTKLQKSKPESKKTPPKKQSKAKTVKNNTTNATKEKESKVINSITDKTLQKESTKSQKQETKNIQSKTESKDGIKPTQDKKNYKKGTRASQNKIESNPNKTVQTRHDKVSPQKNNTPKTKKPDLNIKDKNTNIITPCFIKINMPNLSDSLIYEDNFNETNNNHIRPVRSCRLSKQNNSLDTRKVNQTLNVTLRSRQKKPAADCSESKEQANLRDLSLAQKKPISSIKLRVKEAKKIDYSDSDISFSLTDKDSHLKSRGKSAKLLKNALTNRKVPMNTPNKNELLTKERLRTSVRISNRKCLS